MAYTLDRAPREAPRPLTFAWNGGPGSNSLLLQLSALGPRRLTDDGERGDHAGLIAFEDNEATWLDATDLVFVDPIGTGFSRPSRPEYADDFYGVLGDIATTVEFIRTYRARFDAWDAPVYLAGESYGVWRAAGAAESMERAGQRVVRNTDGPPGGTPPWPRRAMDLDPALRTFVATGMYDSLNSCPANSCLLSRLAPRDAGRITFRCYEGGHMMYEDRQPRLDLARDMRRFYGDRGRW